MLVERGSGVVVTGHDLWLNHLKSDPGEAAGLEVQHLGCAVRDVHDSVPYVGPAVIDLDDEPFTVPEVGYLDPTAQRQCFACSRVLIHIVRLTAGGRTALEPL